MQDVFIVSATRSAIGSFGGSLKDTSPIDLARISPVPLLKRPVLPPMSSTMQSSVM